MIRWATLRCRSQPDGAFSSGWAKKESGGVLNNYNDTFGHVWNGIGTVTGGIHDGWEATKGGLRSAVADTASAGWHKLTSWF